MNRVAGNTGRYQGGGTPDEALGQVILEKSAWNASRRRVPNRDHVAAESASETYILLSRTEHPKQPGRSRLSVLIADLAACTPGVRTMISLVTRQRVSRSIVEQTKFEKWHKPVPDESRNDDATHTCSFLPLPHWRTLSAEEHVDMRDLLGAIDRAVQGDWRLRITWRLLQISVELNLPYTQLCLAIGLPPPSFRRWKKRLTKIARRLAGLDESS